MPLFHHAQLLLKLSGDSMHVFSYAGGDEFNEAALNLNRWKDSQWPTVNMAQEFVYSPQNVSLRKGVVVFAMTKKDSMYRIDPLEIDSNFLKEKKLTLNDRQYLFHYAAGSIVSQQKLHYGLYELRFKVEEGKGVWPAFWFYGGNKNEEIDAFELKGERNDEIHVDTHCPEGCDRGYKNKLGFNTNWGGWMPVSDFLHNGFNLMQLEWAPNEITWYVNGYPLAWFKGRFPNPMNLYINTQVAKDGRAFKPGPDKTTAWPNHFYVDYLRIWKKIDTTCPVLAVNRLDESDLFSSDYETKPLRKRGLMYSKKKFEVEGMLSLILLPDGKLKVKPLGLFLKKATSLEILWDKGNAYIPKMTGDSEIFLAPSKMYTLVVKTGNKEYRQNFRVVN